MIEFSRFGMGCAGIAGMYQACPEDRALATMEAAWNAGIRYFDTAPFYGTGLSEQRLGKFLAGKPRDDFVVSTKAGRLLTPVAEGMAPDNGFVGALPALVHFDYSGPGILRSVAESLTRLGVARIGMLYLHDIGRFAHGTEAPKHMAALEDSGFAALHRLKADGIIGGWGLGVNEVEVCLDVLSRHQPDAILLAGRYTLLDRRAEADLLPLCLARGVPLVLGGVLNSGILAGGAVPGARFNYEPAPPEILAKVAGLETACRDHGTSLLSAALGFPLHHPAVASVLLGNADPNSLRANLAAAAQPFPPGLADATRPHSLH